MMRWMKKVWPGLLLLIIMSGFILPRAGQAQTAMQPPVLPDVPTTNYTLGKVLEVVDAGTTTDELTQQSLPYQKLKVLLDDDSVQLIMYGGIVVVQPEQLLQVGDRVVVLQQTTSDKTRYDIVDRYRLPQLAWIGVIFCVVVLGCIRWRGIGTLVSVALTLVVVVQWLIPQLLVTSHPLAITFVTLVGLAVLNFYLGHGFSKTTTIALLCTIACLGIALVVATLVTSVLHLSGTGSEAALNLKYGFAQNVDLSGLLLAGLLISALGILDDVTTAQVQSVHELKQADPRLDMKALFQKGFNIGRAHIISLVNTLILAYAGAGLPAFLVLTNFSQQPLWLSLNSEPIVEELVQMLVGSLTLVLAVPLTTFVAAWWVARQATNLTS